MTGVWDALEEFDAHLTELADEAGVELGDDARRALFQASMQGGFDPESTVEAFDAFVGEADLDDFDDFDDSDFEDELLDEMGADAPEPDPEPATPDYSSMSDAEAN